MWLYNCTGGWFHPGSWSGVTRVPCFTESVPMWQEHCIISDFTPLNSQSSVLECVVLTHRDQHAGWSSVAVSGPGCSTSPGIVLAPIRDGPWALKSVNRQLLELSPPAPGTVIRGAAGFKGLRSSLCGLAAWCSGSSWDVLPKHPLGLHRVLGSGQVYDEGPCKPGMWHLLEDGISRREDLLPGGFQVWQWGISEDVKQVLRLMMDHCLQKLFFSSLWWFFVGVFFWWCV